MSIVNCCVHGNLMVSGLFHESSWTRINPSVTRRNWLVDMTVVLTACMCKVRPIRQRKATNEPYQVDCCKSSSNRRSRVYSHRQSTHRFVRSISRALINGSASWSTRLASLSAPFGRRRLVNSRVCVVFAVCGKQVHGWAQRSGNA